jgi:SulP family sulfate permease
MGASVLAYMMGAKTRLVGIFMAMLFAAVLLFGTTLIVFVPKLLLGGLLIYLGFSMMERWLYGGLSAMGREDYAIVVLIVVVVAVFGYLQGIAIGMLAAIVTFVFHYSRINVIKHTFSGAGYQSKVDRPVFHRRHLISTGDQLTIYVLEGALFFGTANNLLNQIKQRVDDTERRQPKFLILNFHMVKRLDSSVVMAFNKLRLLAQHGGFVLVFTGLNQQTERIFQHNRFSLEDTDTFRNISEPDEAVEWCEDQTLKEERITREILPQSLKGQLEMMFPNLVDYEGMVQYLKKQHFEAGDYLARQGDPSDSIYFIEQGSVSVQLEVEGGTTTRLRKLGAGTLIGEIALYSHRSRSASVIAETTATVYSLSNEDLQRMETEQPNVAAAFHKFIAHLLAERLADNTTSLSV